MDNDRDLEEIRRRKMEEIQSSNSQAQSREAERQQEEKVFSSVA